MKRFASGLICFLGLFVIHNAQAQDNAFSIAPGFSFSWYPYADYIEGDSEMDIEQNIGLSALMNIKLFRKINVHIDFGLNDPTFKKMIDIAGRIDIFNFIMMFDYHKLKGNVKWKGSTPNPFPDDKVIFDFDTTLTNVSLMFRIDQLFNLSEDILFLSFGISYSQFNMPVEYKKHASEKQLNFNGFGNITGTAWGAALLADSMIMSMGWSDSNTSLYAEPAMEFYNNGTYAIHGWVWMYFILAGVLEGSFDKKSVDKMAEINNVDSINSGFERVDSTYAKLSLILGLLNRWEIGFGRIGLAFGAELLWEQFGINSKDLRGESWSVSIGPVIRLSAKF